MLCTIILMFTENSIFNIYLLIKCDINYSSPESLSLRHQDSQSGQGNNLERSEGNDNYY